MTIDVASLRKDFPIFSRTIRDGKRLVYLDSGATSHKPSIVIDREAEVYRRHNAAAHRGAHQLAEEATEILEESRRVVADFIGAQADDVIFTKSATESLNLVAYSMTSLIKPGDRIVVSEMEHHANLIPWQQLAKRTGAELAWFSVTSDGRLDLSDVRSIITPQTKIVAITHQSNVLGTINPLEEIVGRAKEVGAWVVLDACQSAPHLKLDVTALGVDFCAFSGHKALGPSGVGVLWGRGELLALLPPFLFGGSMIESVTMTDATWAPAPRKFEPGVPNVAGIAALAEALKYLSSLGMETIHEHEKDLVSYALTELSSIEELRIVGPTNLESRGGTISFTVGEIHPHDLGQYLDSTGVAVRTGHHCAWPLTKKMGVPATTRASFYIYNDRSDVDALVSGIRAAKAYFA